MKSRRQLALTLATLLLSFLTGGTLLAQDQDSGSSPNGDPPARVARIQYISGEVSMQPGGVNDWVAASLNRPLTSSDRVWTDKDSRTELNVGTGFIRLNSESSLTLTNVSDNTVQVQLDQGTLELTVRHLEPGEVFEIDTPNLAFTVMKSGVYRIDVPPNDNQTWVTVHKGNGEATGRGPAVKVNSGEQVRFTGQGTLQNTAYAEPAADGFDDWAQVRDKRLEGSQSARYVAPGVIGYEDLDYYGTWRTVPTYGAVWVPTTVQAGWAPYRFGRWVWVSPWGWTWVDDAAWGFAPFHYGRWVFVGGTWGWAPGPRFVGWRPFYAPALVGWVGGAGWGIGVSFGFGWGGGCGWFPLGWGEPFYPWYRGGFRGGFVSQTYIRNVNVTNTTINNITNVTNNYYNGNINNTHFANRNIAGAVTAAPKSALANGENISRIGKAVPASELGKGELLRNVGVSPNRQAVLGGHAPLTTGVPPRSAMDRPVVTRTAAPAPATSPALPAATRNVPPAPATLGAHNPNAGVTNQSSTAPHPPASGNPTSNANSAYGSQSGTQHVVPRPPSAGVRGPVVDRNTATSATYGSNSASQSAAHNDVPKPPYAGGHAPAATEAVSHTTNSGYQAAHGSAAAPEPSHAGPPNPPANRSAKPIPPANESKPKETTKVNPGTASMSAPRPPAGYTYKPAPAYAASSYTGGNSSGGSHSYAANTTPYAGNRSGYAAPAAYRGGGYEAAPTYSPRTAASAVPHSSAPSYSGGGGSASGGSGGHSNSSGGHTASHRR